MNTEAMPQVRPPWRLGWPDARSLGSAARFRCLLFLCALAFGARAALATSNHQYGPDEYVTVANGLSPDGKYAVTAHGEGELGDDHFHLFLTDAVSGKRIGPLEEVKDTLDTGADAFAARWSPDTRVVTIVYRVDRHAPLKAITYQIGNHRARPLKGPFDVTNADLIHYWQEQSSTSKPSPKVFGTPHG